MRASTPYGYYIIIRGGGGCPGSRRPLRIAISIVVTDGLQTVWCLRMARDIGFGAAVAAWQLAWQPVGGQTRTKTSKNVAQQNLTNIRKRSESDSFIFRFDFKFKRFPEGKAHFSGSGILLKWRPNKTTSS